MDLLAIQTSSVRLQEVVQFDIRDPARVVHNQLVETVCGARLRLLALFVKPRIAFRVPRSTNQLANTPRTRLSCPFASE